MTGKDYPPIKNGENFDLMSASKIINSKKPAHNNIKNSFFFPQNENLALIILSTIGNRVWGFLCVCVCVFVFFCFFLCGGVDVLTEDSINKPISGKLSIEYSSFEE